MAVRVALTAGAFALSGCFGILHPLQVKPSALPPDAGPVVAPGREHVHVVLVNGLDPLYVGNLDGLSGYVRDLGFPGTHLYQFWQTESAHHEVLRLRTQDPQARFVLVGFSLGANYARKLANELNDDRVPVELLVYLGGDTVRDGPYSRPPNVRRVANIMGDGLIFLGRNMAFCGEEIEGASNHRQKWTRHICLPSRKETIDLLSAELLAAADRPPTGPAPNGPVVVRSAPAATPPAEPVSIIHHVDHVRPRY
jgi:hypothetical protein